jgi:hypothetical protein
MEGRVMTRHEKPDTGNAAPIELPLASPPKPPVIITEAAPTSLEGDIDRGDEPWTSGKYGPDWSRAGDDVAVTHQPAIAVYENTQGAIVIRQEDPLGDDDDTIIVQVPNLAALISKLSEYIPNRNPGRGVDAGPPGGR